MSKDDLNMIKLSLEYIHAFYEQHGEKFVFHNYAFINENLNAAKEIAKAEGLKKEEYEMGLLAIILKDVGTVSSPDEALDSQQIIQKFITQSGMPEHQAEQLNYYIDYLRSNRFPKSPVEEVIRDGADIFLSLPDAPERIGLLRMERQDSGEKTYDDEQWFELCKRYLITHVQYTGYAKKKYGPQRAKNLYEIERKLEKAKSESARLKRLLQKSEEANSLSNKETEDLFKIAFRNYVDLISVADRKAGLLIQVNAILLSVIIGFTIRRIESAPLYIIPTGILLISALITIFNAILASRPQEQTFENDTGRSFFFGSFDRIDPDFKKVTWENYQADMKSIFNGDKNEIFNQITKETFQVRRVLSKKFGYLAIAYKVFIAGLGMAILTFIIVALIKL